MKKLQRKGRRYKARENLRVLERGRKNRGREDAIGGQEGGSAQTRIQKGKRGGRGDWRQNARATDEMEEKRAKR